jgi:hypothetical protein
MLGKFNTRQSAFNASNRTEKASAVILGCDGLFWLVNLATMARLLKQGYELAQ